MRRVKVRTFAGSVCEQVIYTISDRAQDPRKAKPQLRFKDEEERAQHKQEISRRKHARLVNENFNPTSLYSTLTFDDEHEVHTFEEARYIRDLFVRRLRYACPEAVIYIYMGRGKSTDRIHFHMLSTSELPQEVIQKQWLYGRVVRISHLREHNYYDDIDHGQDYTGLANYLFDHWTPEVGGHRWKATRNSRQPDKGEPKEIVRHYSADKPPIAPKGYILVETKATRYGYLYFKYVKEPPKHRREPKRKRQEAKPNGTG